MLEFSPRAITHDEADIIMAYNMIEESVGGHSPIRIVADGTDVLIIITHQLKPRTNNLPATVNVTMEACSGRHTVIDVNAIVQQHAAVISNKLAAHALTECDTTSSVTTIGKATVFKRLPTFNERLRLGEGEKISQMKYSLPVNDVHLPVTGSFHQCRLRRCVYRCCKKVCRKSADFSKVATNTT